MIWKVGMWIRENAKGWTESLTTPPLCKSEGDPVPASSLKALGDGTDRVSVERLIAVRGSKLERDRATFDLKFIEVERHASLQLFTCHHPNYTS